VEDEADEDWMKQMDLEAMKMFVQERDVFHIEEELKEDPVAIIMPSDGITSIWSFENNFLDVVFNNFESIYPISNYLVNEMNLNFDYMHVSFGNEALNTEKNLNDEQNEAKIKPIENETIKINLGTLENPKKVKIGSTLSSEEQEESLSYSKNFLKYLHGHTKICLGSTLITCNTKYQLSERSNQLSRSCVARSQSGC
jgi:hypothetical protein